MSTHDGGPAFPHEDIHDVNAGMSLLDFFAGQALAGMLAAGSDDRLADELPARAYEFSAGMLAQRDRWQVHADEAPPPVPAARIAEEREAANQYALKFLRSQGYGEAAEVLERDLAIPF